MYECILSLKLAQWSPVAYVCCVSCLTLWVLCPLVPRVLIDGANLTITNVTLEDEGTYSCWAHTTLDSASDATQVTVLGGCCCRSALILPLAHLCLLTCSFHYKRWY